MALPINTKNVPHERKSTGFNVLNNMLTKCLVYHARVQFLSVHVQYCTNIIYFANLNRAFVYVPSCLFSAAFFRER